MNKDNNVLFGIAITGLLLTLLFFITAFQHAGREAARDYVSGLFVYSERLEHDVVAAERLLKDLQTRFDSSRDVPSEPAFHRYTDEQLPHHYGLSSVTFLRRVNAGQRADYERLMQASGKQDYRIQPVDEAFYQDSPAAMHLAVYYSNGPEAVALQQPGRDWLTHAGLQEKLLAAGHSNETVSAVHNDNLYLLQAIYAKDIINETLHSREKVLHGVLALQYDLRLLLREMEWQPGLRLELVESNTLWEMPARESLLPIATALHPLRLGNQDYRLQMSYPIQFSDIDTMHITLVLVAGILLTLSIMVLYQAYAQRLAALRVSAEMGLKVISKQADTLERQGIELAQQQQVLDAHSIVSVADVDGYITYVNDRFCEVSGYRREELLGQNHRIVRSGEHSDEFYAQLWATISAGKAWHGIVCNQRKDGSLYWVDSTIQPFLDAKGRPEHYISVRTDITPLMQTRDALVKSEQSLLQTQAFANIGSWDWNIQTGQMQWSEQVTQMLGRDNRSYSPSYENYLLAIPPLDREGVITAIEACNHEGRELSITHRILWPDRSIHWLQLKGNVTRAEDGTPLHLLCIVQDITQRSQMELMLDKQKRLLDMLRQAMLHYVQTPSLQEVAKDLLAGLLQVTDCSLGFLGEVNTDEDTPYITMHAVSNIAWDEDSRERYTEGQLMSRDKHSLLTYVLNSGLPLISNNATIDPRGGGVPIGHTRIENFLGMPVYYGEEMVGIFALANREDGFDHSLMDFLQPLQATYGILIHAMRSAKHEEQTRQDLLNAKLDAEHASRAKSEFLSNMSHELRTPLNAIMGFSQLLAEDSTTPLTEEQKESTNEIYQAGQHLLELVNEILDLARIESGRMEVRCEQVAMHDVFEQCISLTQPLAEMHDIQFTADMDGLDGIWVEADHVRLKQAIINLLSNAIKYNRQQGKVRLVCEVTESDWLRISITDTGQGISRQDQEKIFIPFERLGAEQTTIEGSGIGLTITQRMVELMGGRMGVDSVLEQGSCFWIELRRCVAVEAIAIPELGMSAAATEKEAADDITDAGNTYKILYVEDNPANVRLMRLLMRQRPDYTLLVAENGEEGVRMAQSIHPDIVLMDINLPGINGIEVADILRGDWLTKDVPLVAVSANVMPADIEKAAAAGFEAYLTKPLDARKLFQVLDEYLPDKGSSEYIDMQ